MSILLTMAYLVTDGPGNCHLNRYFPPVPAVHSLEDSAGAPHAQQIYYFVAAQIDGLFGSLRAESSLDLLRLFLLC